MDKHSTPPGMALLSTAQLRIEPAPQDHWLQARSRLHAGRLKKDLSDILGIELPGDVNSCSSCDGGPDVLVTAPGCWLLRYPLGKTLGRPLPYCSVTDISDSRLGFRVSGKLSLELLATGCPVQLTEPLEFTPDCAQSLFHHIPLLVHRLQEDVMDLLVPRSYLAEFQHALLHSARSLVALHNNENG